MTQSPYRFRPHTPSPRSGFSLVEMAVVLVILGYLLSGLLPSLSARYEASKMNDAKTQLSEIKLAIIGFALANRRLPCPDITGDGSEDVTAGSCARDYGEPPWANLSTPQLNPWNQPILYRVTGLFADNTDGTGSTDCAAAPPGVSFQLCSTGDISLSSTNASPPPATVTITIPMVLVSQGKPRGSISTFEQENADNDNVFRKEDYNNLPGTEFNDIVDWVSANVLVYHLVEAGVY